MNMLKSLKTNRNSSWMAHLPPLTTLYSLLQITCSGSRLLFFTTAVLFLPLHWNYLHLATESSEHFLSLSILTFPRRHCSLKHSLCLPSIFFLLPWPCLSLLCRLCVCHSLGIYRGRFLLTPYSPPKNLICSQDFCYFVDNFQIYIVIPDLSIEFQTHKSHCFMDVSTWQFKFNLTLSSASQTEISVQISFLAQYWTVPLFSQFL